ncbi:hypothetical protein FB550_12126 [Neobacillus bataviensis]|uniref:Uncharacterized protein n=1 Tax=Neobacillus bataviensis TaxID=220685 RepID=A0A561CKE8_9BACI|nr:hypothetical protein [Neobacillus bataviensis]TWD91584.1 hypothetical protein FB550_12126 [Neobacillus bataviensis]
MNLEDIYKEFLYDLEIKNYSPRTIKGYKNNNKANKSIPHESKKQRAIRIVH